MDFYKGVELSYLCLTELTPAILSDLVKAVYVHTPDKSSGHQLQLHRDTPCLAFERPHKRKLGMAEIMPHSENNLNLFYWALPRLPYFSETIRIVLTGRNYYGSIRVQTTAIVQLDERME